MTRIGRFEITSILLAAAGCAGQITASNNPDAAPAAQVDAAPSGADATPTVPAFDVSGTTKDYESGDPLANVALATDGLGGMQTTSDMMGAYTLAQVPASSAFMFRAMPSGTTYIPTVNPSLTVLDANVQTDVRVVSTVYAHRQYTTVGAPMQMTTSLVIIDLKNLDGTSFVGVPLEGISLVPMGMMTPMTLDHYFIGATGDVDPALLVSTEFPAPGGGGGGGGGMMMGGHARVAFLNVPTGMYTVQVSFTAPGGGTTTIKASGSATTYDAGATLTRVIHDPAGDGGAMTYTFTNDVYPILQRASAGGQDCANCHTMGGAAGNVLILDDGAPAVHARLIASPLYINLTTPADSLLLTKPLYEMPPNHPNAVWLDTTDPNYMKILAWITAGAPL